MARYYFYNILGFEVRINVSYNKVRDIYLIHPDSTLVERTLIQSDINFRDLTHLQKEIAALLLQRPDIQQKVFKNKFVETINE